MAVSLNVSYNRFWDFSNILTQKKNCFPSNNCYLTETMRPNKDTISGRSIFQGGYTTFGDTLHFSLFNKKIKNQFQWQYFFC